MRHLRDGRGRVNSEAGISVLSLYRLSHVGVEVSQLLFGRGSGHIADVCFQEIVNDHSHRVIIVGAGGSNGLCYEAVPRL